MPVIDEKISDILNSHNWPGNIFELMNISEILINNTENPNEAITLDLVKNIITELKIPFIDIHKEVFKKEQNPLKLFPFEQVGHYNVEGYKKVAKAIYEFTKD